MCLEKVCCEKVRKSVRVCIGGDVCINACMLRGDGDMIRYLGKVERWRRDDPTVTSAVLNDGFYGEKLVAPYHHLQDKGRMGRRRSEGGGSERVEMRGGREGGSKWGRSVTSK